MGVPDNVSRLTQVPQAERRAVALARPEIDVREDQECGSSYNVIFMTALFSGKGPDRGLQEAAWVARCVGDSRTTPLIEEDLAALASYLSPREHERGALLFHAGDAPPGALIMRAGVSEMVVGSGPRRSVVGLLRPGEVDGDLQLILGMSMPYSARTLERTRVLLLEPANFESLLTEHPTIARRWLSSVAARVSASQARIMELLGRSLVEQVARLLLDEERDGRIPLPQRTLAAMLGAQRPSLNKILKQLEEKGLVSLGYAEVRIEQPEALGKLAAGRGGRFRVG